MKMEFDFRDLNRAALERMVKQLLTASDKEERDMMKKLQKRAEKNDLADLDEEMHGKANAPDVTDDDLPYDGDDELPDVPKKKGKK
jgi:L-2-hydroxyglutarate oxidase LhgO